MKNTICKSLIFLLLSTVLLLNGCGLFYSEKLEKKEEIPEENLVIYTDSYLECTAYKYFDKVAIKSYSGYRDELLLRTNKNKDWEMSDEDSFVYLDGIFERYAYNNGKLFIDDFNNKYYVFNVDDYDCVTDDYECHHYYDDFFKEAYPDYESYNWRDLRNVNETEAEEIKKEVGLALDLDLSKETVKVNYDYRGFLGDGTTLVAIKIQDDTELQEKLEKSKVWNELPLPNEIRDPLESLSQHYKSFYHKNGYYFFFDRSSEIQDSLSNDPLDYSELNSRHSYNFIVGIYDADEKYLYYFKGDT